MKLTLVLFGLLLSPCLFAQNNRSSDSREGKLIALERMWNQAQLMHDSGALQSLIGERFLSTEWDGQLELSRPVPRRHSRSQVQALRHERAGPQR